MTEGGHAMPFGAALTERGVRFRLWAPAARNVELQLEDAGGPRLFPMEPAGGGWFDLLTDAACAGSRYRYRIEGGTLVPDPASRYQPGDVHGPSMVVDPGAYVWTQTAWRGRPWHEAVIYELHVGTFTAESTFDGVRKRLDHLVDLGVTAVELMPVADFPGRRNWGYDGVLPYAPDSAYGATDDLKRLIDEAHGRGLMMFLDVVYNHFGPDGNYLHIYAPHFFTQRFATPWGAAIDFARREVRDFFIHNALYWLEEYRFDGLRFDAVHAIIDEGSPDILEEIADAVHRRFGDERHIHLVLENDHNAARYLERGEEGRPRYYVAQWNDDIHHAFHVLATGERAGYYEDYAGRPVEHLGRCLAEGFAYQGEPSPHRGGKSRGEPSAHLPATAFVSFIQNHDQVGNRAFGERISAISEPQVLKTLLAVLLLAPSPPLLFMGEEWGATEPFLFFCDFHDELAESVRQGRRCEFARFPEFRDEAARQRIPDPNAAATFEASRLDWSRIAGEPHAAWLDFYRELLWLRNREIVPHLARLQGNAGGAQRFGEGGLYVTWRLCDGRELALVANFASRTSRKPPVSPRGRLLYGVGDGLVQALDNGELPPWSAAWFLT
jgi:maltooligosyltrehalose trehalohydrolase